jgi:hypothetical protein
MAERPNLQILAGKNDKRQQSNSQTIEAGKRKNGDEGTLLPIFHYSIIPSFH